MSSHDELVTAAKQFLDEVQVFSTLAESRYVAGWIVVAYDPETNEFLARGPFEHPRAAEEFAQESQRDLTSDGSPGLHQMVMPLYDWTRGG